MGGGGKTVEADDPVGHQLATPEFGRRQYGLRRPAAPLDQNAWQVEFDKYKAIPQYRERNAGMSLADFKTIYWWEWTHRVLARLVGGVFLLPLLWFLWRGQVEPHLRALCGGSNPAAQAESLGEFRF
jgi:hypothetical protein